MAIMAIIKETISVFLIFIIPFLRLRKNKVKEIIPMAKLAYDPEPEPLLHYKAKARKETIVHSNQLII